MEKDADKSKSNVHAGHRKRLKERFLKEGLDSFQPHQILELLLFYALPQRDTNELAHKLIDRFGSLSRVFDTDPKDLQSIGGISENTSALIALIPQLSRIYQKDRMRSMTVVDSSTKACEYVQTLFTGRLYEAFFVICMDKNNKIQHEVKVCEGTIDEVPCYPRLVMETVLRHQAQKVIFAHNHPSGKRNPSTNDIEYTQVLARVLSDVDIELVDHIIVGADGYISMADLGYVSLDGCR